MSSPALAGLQRSCAAFGIVALVGSAAVVPSAWAQRVLTTPDTRGGTFGTVYRTPFLDYPDGGIPIYHPDLAERVARIGMGMAAASRACDVDAFNRLLDELRALRRNLAARDGTGGFRRLPGGLDYSRLPASTNAREYDANENQPFVTGVGAAILQAERELSRMRIRCRKPLRPGEQTLPLPTDTVRPPGLSVVVLGRSYPLHKRGPGDFLREMESELPKCGAGRFLNLVIVANQWLDDSRKQDARSVDFFANYAFELGEYEHDRSQFKAALAALEAEYERRCARRDAPPAPGDTGGPSGPMAEFSVVLGVRNNTASGSYTSNGGQDPGSGQGSKSQTNFGMTIAGYVPLPQFLAHDPNAFLLLGTTQVGARFGVYHLGGGNKLVLDIIRHGPDGAVQLTEKERHEITLMFMLRQTFWLNTAVLGRLGQGARPGEYARRRTHKEELAAAEPGAPRIAPGGDLAQAPAARPGNYWPIVVYAGVGPSFVNTNVQITSNQVPGGGVAESTSQRKWDTALSFVVGGQTAVCRNCVFGNPIMIGVEGQWTRLPKRDVAVTSSTFGFSETGTVESRSSSRFMFTVTVPFGLGR